MDCVDCLRWTAPASGGGPALPTDPTPASAGLILTQPAVSGNELLTLLQGRKSTGQTTANTSHGAGRASTWHAKDGDWNSRGLCPGPDLSRLSYVPVQSPAFAAMLREVTTVFEVSGSQEEHES